jgi:hypothetical protein
MILNYVVDYLIQLKLNNVHLFYTVQWWKRIINRICLEKHWNYSNKLSMKMVINMIQFILYLFLMHVSWKYFVIHYFRDFRCKIGTCFFEKCSYTLWKDDSTITWIGTTSSLSKCCYWYVNRYLSWYFYPRLFHFRFGKCSDIQTAKQIFDTNQDLNDVVSWGAIVSR